jgi:hypothetical protein
MASKAATLVQEPSAAADVGYPTLAEEGFDKPCLTKGEALQLIYRAYVGTVEADPNEPNVDRFFDGVGELLAASGFSLPSS